MYDQSDLAKIRSRTRRYTCILLILAAVLLGIYVLCMIRRWEAGAMVAACALFIAVCFMVLEFIWPCSRYGRFLQDMSSGLSREMVGSIVEISGEEELQDGVRVHPVRILLDKDNDERIVYLNVDKAEGFPGAGERVRLQCYGRHIKEVAGA